MYKKIIAAFAVLSVLCGCVAGQKSADDTSDNTISTTATTNDVQSTNVADTTVTAAPLDAQNYSTDKVIWGPGNIKEHKRPADPVSLQKQYAHLGARFIMESNKQLCLTFDEGYENGYTPKILDTLKEKNIKAIFFVTYDFAKSNPELIKRMINEGHIVGNHTYRHYTMDEVTIKEATREIEYLDAYIDKTYKYKMSYFRFPKGEFSESTLALAQKMGYTSVFWSFAYADWDTDNVASPDDALKTVCDSLHPGAIYLLHAVSPTNAEILPSFIESAKKQGYTFTVDL